MNNRTAILISTAILTACGGGGGGGNASTPAAQTSTPAPQVGFASGTFEPYQNFEQMCENPRSGVDSRGRAFR
ncbi:MAG: hypothetical protein HOG19_09360, partial [Gammaproteobacteria bacterium]|nr:hypothetical protein [Gammaproteobacteria bacterium]